ncbi:MAG: hypothetical protein IIZ27_00605 [Solobacterium sp.]|nr:hypothetical protein [Solobacterium sp.]
MPKTYSIPMSDVYLSKDICRKKARQILQDRFIEGMTERQIASEIYFHSAAYYTCVFLEKFHIRINYIKKKADPIDLADNGDTGFRRILYRIIWALPEVRGKDKHEI